MSKIASDRRCARLFLNRLPLVRGVGWISILLWGSVLLAEEFPEEQIAFFEKKIRPVLVSHCYGCHSAQSPQVKGGLLLDTRLGVLRGGESGEVVVPGQPASSTLMRALRYDDEVSAMPPKKQLPKEVIANFEHWIAIGLPDPRDGESILPKAGIDIDKGRRF